MNHNMPRKIGLDVWIESPDQTVNVWYPSGVTTLCPARAAIIAYDKPGFRNDGEISQQTFPESQTKIDDDVRRRNTPER
jgi:hypothetical protein